MLPDPDWDLDESDEAPTAWSRRRRFVWLGLALATLIVAFLLARSMLQDSSQKERPRPPMIQTVTLPPPPPPPPKRQEKPPEPPKQVEVKPTQTVPQNKPPAAKAPPKAAAAANPNPRPAGAPLTAAPGGGNNPYGLQAGNGGGDVIGGGGGGGEGGAGYGFYAIKVQSQLQAALMRNERTRRGNYNVVADLWLSGAGRIDRVEITRSSGDPELDAALADVLKRQTISEAPPAGMPQPIRTRIAARG